MIDGWMCTLGWFCICLWWDCGLIVARRHIGVVCCRLYGFCKVLVLVLVLVCGGVWFAIGEVICGSV